MTTAAVAQWELTQEQVETVITVVNKKVKDENYNQKILKQYFQWDTKELESYLMEKGLKDAEKFNTGTKGDNFLRYIRQVVNMDYKDFLKKFLKESNRYGGDIYGTPNNHDGQNFREEELYGGLDYGYEAIQVREMEDYIYSDAFGLTERQRVIFKARIQGYTQKEVARHFGVSEKTVSVDAKKVNKKLADNAHWLIKTFC